MAKVALACFLACRVTCGLRFDGANKNVQSRDSKKYAYVTMMLDPALLTEEESNSVNQPNLWGGLSGPFIQAALTGKKYVNGTLDHVEHVSGDHTERRAIASLNRQRDQNSGKWAEKESEHDLDAVGVIYDSDLERPMLGGGYDAWPAVEAIAKQLQKVGSQYPLVVLTNRPEKLDAGITAEFPNLIPTPMGEWFTGRTCKASMGYEKTLQKIKIWELTDYDKVMWLDTDVEVKINPDPVFEKEVNGGVMAMISDPSCDYAPNYTRPEKVVNRQVGVFDGEKASGMVQHELSYANTTMHDLASSVMLLEPSLADYEGMKQVSKDIPTCGTDQELIAEHFWRKAKTDIHETVQFFGPEVAMWGRCAVKKFQGPEAVDPMIVHKPRKTSWNMRR